MVRVWYRGVGEGKEDRGGDGVFGFVKGVAGSEGGFGVVKGAMGGKGGKQRRRGIEGDEGGLGVVNGHLMVVKGSQE